MDHDLELPLFAPTVFREVLWGKRYFERMAEIQAAGGKIEMQEVGKTNAQWIITWRHVKTDTQRRSFPEDSRPIL